MKNISEKINKYLKEMFPENKNEIDEKILQIAENLDENNLTEDEFNYLITKFETRFNQYKNWISNGSHYIQNYKKVGEEYEDRYCYIKKFLDYFDKIKEQNKCLNEENFQYLYLIISKILELNMNEDIDYELCKQALSLSSKYYKVDETKKSRKQYINEVIQNCPIMQKQGFWVGMITFELNKELNPKKIEKEFLGEEISNEKINKDTVNILIPVLCNLIQCISDSKLLNDVIYEIFEYYKINKEKRVIIINRILLKFPSEDIINKIDKDLIFSES